MKITAAALGLIGVWWPLPTVTAFDMPRPPSSRRALLEQVGVVAATALTVPSVAWASGGATAGKYTTIPIAKRRYYGRVQQAVHDFVSEVSCV